MGYCTDGDLLTLAGYVSQEQASDICSLYNVTAIGTEAALIKYLAQSQATGIDASFTLFSGYLVFLMQAGFALICAAAVRRRSSGNVLLKNVVDACVGGICYYLVGFAFAFGSSSGSNAFIGSGNYALSDSMVDNSALQWKTFFFQWTFSATSATIIAGAVAERVAFEAYLGCSALMSGLVYPVVSHWLWAGQGWLSATNTNPLFGSGAIDFSGSGVVHLTGATAALMGILALGPRLGRFHPEGKGAFLPCRKPSTVAYMTLGTFLLWFGWYGFNPGSLQRISNAVSAATVARTAVCTTLGACGGALSGLLMSYSVEGKRWDLVQLCNGALCGLVAVTAGCSVIQPYAALIIGLLTAPLFIGSVALLMKCQLDDVVSAVPMHGACGLFGVLAVGLFAVPQYVNEIYPEKAGPARYGAFYGGSGQLLACQVIEVLAILAWVGAVMGLYFFAMKFARLLRVPLEQELAGLDASKYGVLTTNALPTPQQPNSFSPHPNGPGRPASNASDVVAASVVDDIMVRYRSAGAPSSSFVRLTPSNASQQDTFTMAAAPGKQAA